MFMFARTDDAKLQDWPDDLVFVAENAYSVISESNTRAVWCAMSSEG
jgi:hypothetical protein